MAEAKFNVGDKVRVLFDTPGDDPIEGTVKIVNDEKKNPGKLIGVEFNSLVAYGHSLDGEVEERESPTGEGPTMGKGWWTRPEYLEKL